MVEATSSQHYFLNTKIKSSTRLVIGVVAPSTNHAPGYRRKKHIAKIMIAQMLDEPLYSQSCDMIKDQMKQKNMDNFASQIKPSHMKLLKIS